MAMDMEIRQPNINLLSKKDAGAVVKIRLAKTDCRLMLTSVARARGEMEGIVELTGWGEAVAWGEWLQGAEGKLQEMVQWARGREDALMAKVVEGE